jgi:hypothetical protein
MMRTYSDEEEAMKFVQTRNTHDTNRAQARRTTGRRCGGRGQTPRCIASVLLASIVSLAACRTSATAPLRVTYATVAVSNGSPHVGDTATARAMAWSAQVLLANPGTFTWSVADSSIVHLEATDSTGRVVVHAVKPGTTVIRAAVSGVTGAGGISVTP